MAPTNITKSTRFPASLEPLATGDIAADAFARFDHGMAPDEVVIELVLPVDTVEYLWRTWARLRCVMPLSAEAGRTFREALYSNRPIANGSDTVAAVRCFVERPLKPCPRCKDGAREYCTKCTSKEASRAARGTLRESGKKPLAPNRRSGVHCGIETTSTSKGGTSIGELTDNEQGVLSDGPRPEPGTQSP